MEDDGDDFEEERQLLPVWEKSDVMLPMGQGPSVSVVSADAGVNLAEGIRGGCEGEIAGYGRREDWVV